ncbi:MAG TPA: hypothetical protein VMX97_00550, partial [Hyphomicrobiaceae bacterium]|nr:hypothetical protein [Hyphomicrobiaceae bacterium]
MIRHIIGAILALSAFAWATTWAEAVTVNVEISTEGEPVPGTTITFETDDGEDIPIELTELTEELEPSPEFESSQPATSEPVTSNKTPDETPALEETDTAGVTPGRGFKVELP